MVLNGNAFAESGKARLGLERLIDTVRYHQTSTSTDDVRGRASHWDRFIVFTISKFSCPMVEDMPVLKHG